MLFVLWCVTVMTGCASLPDTQALIARHSAQAARFENARGPVSVQKSAAIVAELKRKSGDLDILDKQIALEQAISDSPLTLGNQATLLQDGQATYAAMLRAIDQAQDHINLETYILEDDAIGHQFATALLAAQARGVQVNLIHDSVGSLHTARAFFERLKAAGMAVLEFNPINPLAARGPWLINNRDHRKLLIVDGQTVFLGGINISSVYTSGSLIHRAGKAMVNAAAWRDTDLQIQGPVVAEFQKLFLQTWAKQRGPPLAAKAYFPVLKSEGKDIVRAIGSTPDDPYSLIYLTLISAIGNAEKHIHLTNAYFVPDPQLLSALSMAAARGVEVKLILPSHSDSALVFHAGRAHYAGLLQAGVQIFERQDALLHAKTAVIDGVWSTVGSTNLDWRSFLDNDEVNAVILGRPFALQMQAMFEQDLRASQAIDPASWADRPLQFKLKEWLARFWVRLL
ncbi:MAG: cardiolipin synthase [Comamonadaceae bacterium]|nr:MAG: cardiolipin synthase [Comamonadaceae bacterium]